MSSYKDIDLFGSGPQRFIVEAMGQQMVPRLMSAFLSGSQAVGPQEVLVTVQGRLVAPSAQGLREQIEDIRAQLALYPDPGTLIGPDGYAWTGMSFARFEPQGPTAYGREVSLAYIAKFYRLLG